MRTPRRTKRSEWHEEYGAFEEVEDYGEFSDWPDLDDIGGLRGIGDEEDSAGLDDLSDVICTGSSNPDSTAGFGFGFGFDFSECQQIELPELDDREDVGHAEDAEEGDRGSSKKGKKGKKGKSRGQRNKDLGKRGEAAAARYLRIMGYQILEKNWTCPAGEVDIIALDGETLVLVEVKTRSSLKRGLPEASVTPEKRSRYEKILGWYLRKNTVPEMSVRFDVIALLVVSDDRAIIRHHVNAFACCGGGE